MKKLLTASLFCSVALFMSACSDEKKELSQDVFKFDIETETKGFGKYITIRHILSLTTKDDIEIKKITANRGACEVRDWNKEHDGYNLSDNLISDETPPKVCNAGILNKNWIDYCEKLIKWAELSKEDCSYEYKYDLDDTSEDYKNINERVEKTENKKYIENCEKAKQVAKEKYNGKYYYDYKVPMKFGETKQFGIFDCSDVVEFSVYTNKGFVTYSVK
ncbi:hypothetical protein AVBRAN9334_02755 [Campylobacter sp. RM9334]|uniref:hypothetical protein n=1 Tax=Campylobacter sp. RM9334 TaxID=2735732 RepID=UPI001D6907AF|nr:hypothetical protein [Campylobacter sp. RM9334]